MADPTNDQPVRVTGEERPHPALQKLARACIALAQLRLSAKNTEPRETTTEPPAAPDGCRTSPGSGVSDD
jgi:hypothetical protein